METEFPVFPTFRFFRLDKVETILCLWSDLGENGWNWWLVDWRLIDLLCLFFLRWIADYFSKFRIGGSESTRTRDGWLVKHNFKHLINAEENSNVLVFSIAFEAVICQILVISSHNFLALCFHTASRTSVFSHHKGFNSHRWGACPAAPPPPSSRPRCEILLVGPLFAGKPFAPLRLFSATGLSKFAARPTLCNCHCRESGWFGSDFRLGLV